MKSDLIQIDSRGRGFEDAVKETKKAAEYQGLSHQEAMKLQLCAEEMLSMARSVTGEMQASFWLEGEGKEFELHLSTKTVMDKEKRSQLISAATSRKNEAANTFLGRVRDAFERAMTTEMIHEQEIPDEVLSDLANHDIEIREWDGYERSILKKVSDQVKVGIRGGNVELIVIKRFA